LSAPLLVSLLPSAAAPHGAAKGVVLRWSFAWVALALCCWAPTAAEERSAAVEPEAERAGGTGGDSVPDSGSAGSSEPAAEAERAEGNDGAEKRGVPEALEERFAPDEKGSREAMLERIARQLSMRMRTLREREEALGARERALAEREAAAAERERHLGTLEELLKMREETIQRREELPEPQSWNGPEAPSVFGQYAAVLDGRTMQFYHKKNAHVRTPVASTQKLLTALVICYEGELDRLIEVPQEVLRIEPTLVGVKPGELYSRRQLLTALLVRSGNDIAAVLAHGSAGSVEGFVEKMNAFARGIGMSDSNFSNPHGLPAAGQYSTARDIAIAAYEAYQVPDIREMVSLRSYDFVFNDGTVRTIYNTNRILGELEGCNGMKTGFTYAAGNCLVSSVSLDGRDRIAVVIKSARPQVWEDSKRLLEWALDLEVPGEPARPKPAEEEVALR